MNAAGDAGLFDASEVASPAISVDSSVEQRMDVFAETAKSCTQLAAKIRTTLNALSEGAKRGSMSSAKSQIQRASDNVSELSAALAQLGRQEEAIGVGGLGASVTGYTEELRAALAERGVAVVKGPEPYWLAYPAWFKVERNAKGVIDVVLNGDRLDTLRPSLAAESIRSTVNDIFQPKQFADLLRQVRQLLRRAGAAAQSIALDDVYELLSLEPGKKAARRKDFSKAEFFYSVHRLAEALEGGAGAQLHFPPSDRSEILFFTRDGESRKYLTVEFGGSSAR